jgi:putative NADH-flavin reductase
MKLTIFGASGRTGIPLVRRALTAGHEVTALVRDPAKLPIKDDRLTVIQGDVTDPAAVERAIAGADAVISVLGPGPNTPKDIQTRAAHTIIAAMHKHGVRRLVSLTGAGVPAPQDRPKLVNRLFSLALALFAADALRDGEGLAAALRDSGLDWTLVRVPRLTDDPGTGNVRVGWVGVNTGTKIAREDVADWMLRVATNGSYVGQMPMISN